MKKIYAQCSSKEKVDICINRHIDRYHFHYKVKLKKNTPLVYVIYVEDAKILNKNKT